MPELSRFEGVVVTGFDHVGPYTLRVYFGDGTQQTIDFLPMLRGQLFRPLREQRLFNQVCLDDESGTLVWPNDADFDPATLHDWPEVREAMLAMAEKWE